MNTEPAERNADQRSGWDRQRSGQVQCGAEVLETAHQGFGIMVAAGSAVAMALSPLAWFGYVCGVVTTLCAASIAACNFD